MRQSGCGQPSSYVAIRSLGCFWDASWVNPATAAQPGLCLRTRSPLHLKVKFFPDPGRPSSSTILVAWSEQGWSILSALAGEHSMAVHSVLQESSSLSQTFLCPAWGKSTCALLMSGAQASLWTSVYLFLQPWLYRNLSANFQFLVRIVPRVDLFLMFSWGKVSSTSFSTLLISYQEIHFKYKGTDWSNIKWLKK